MVKSHKWKNLVQNHISLSVSNTLHYFLQSHPYVNEFYYLCGVASSWYIIFFEKVNGLFIPSL